MFLHVGNNKNIRVRNIIGIFDADNATISRDTKKYLKEAQQAALAAVEQIECDNLFHRSDIGHQAIK